MDMHHTPFIATIVVSLACAYGGGLIARMAGLPNIVGYVIGGVFVGPHTPGFVADPKLIAELAEIGVALLMFAIGLHFSPRDLLRVWHIAIPGALAQIGISTCLGFGIGVLLGWQVSASVMLGLAIAISSTAVATKALELRGDLSTETGRIILGWLVVQDLVVIIALVMLPLMSQGVPGIEALVLQIGKTLLMMALFAAFLLGVGRWLMPAILRWTARFGSQELFTLGVIVLALGFAYGSAMLTGMSLALGAFFAGLVLGESDLSYQAAAEALPIQNIFTVLFFVSVGALFDPMLLVTAPLQIGAVVLAILAGGIIFFVVMVALGVPPPTAGKAAGTLAQIGEFSFILTSSAVALQLLSRDQQGLVLAAALVTIVLHSLTIEVYSRLGGSLGGTAFDRPRKTRAGSGQGEAEPLASLKDHVVIVGHGRVGSLMAEALRRAGQRFVILEGQWRVSEQARQNGGLVIFGDATRSEVLNASRPELARLIVVAMPDAFQGRRVIELARAANPKICIVARAHSEDEYQYLAGLGAELVVMGEREIALSMSDFTLRRLGLDAGRAQKIVDDLRDGSIGTTSAAA